MRFPIPLLLLGLLALLRPLPASAEFEIFKRDVDPFTGTEVRATTPFERVPTRGFMPVKVTIQNDYPQERTWSVTFRSQPSYGPGGSRFLSSYSVTTTGMSETEHAFMVPVATKADRGLEAELQLTVQSGRLMAQGNYQSLPNMDWRSVAFSKGLAGLNNLDELSKAVDAKGSLSSGGQPAAGIFEPSELPADWRTLSGFDVILLSQKEWDALEPTVRDTFLGWARMGGHLHLFGPNGRGDEEIGMGYLVRWQWDGLKIPFEAVANFLDSRSPNLLGAIREGYQTTPLQSAFGIKDFNPLLVFLILAAFAIVVGPVNLQVWAKPGMRHRLFITTPIISLTASLILLLIILFGDGFGGTGRRAGFILLRSQSEERQAHLVQEQIARTGVLAGRGFPAIDGAWFSPVIMNKSRWTHFDDSYAIDAGFQLGNGRLGGDWFRSRSEQMHLARAVVPTRARLELVAAGGNGQAPQLFNSLGYGLKTLYYKDPSGAFWRSKGPVASGQPVQLETVAPGEFDKAWEQTAKSFSTFWEANIRRLRDQPNQFLAEAENPGSELLPSLPSLRWSNDLLFVAGEPVNRTAP